MRVSPCLVVRVKYSGFRSFSRHFSYTVLRHCSESVRNLFVLSPNRVKVILLMEIRSMELKILCISLCNFKLAELRLLLFFEVLACILFRGCILVSHLLLHRSEARAHSSENAWASWR